MMLEFYGTQIDSRLLIGTALYPSPQILSNAINASRSKLVTVSVRREAARARSGQGFWEIIKQLDVHVLPNTAGCKNGKRSGDNRTDGTGAVRDRLDKTRSHRQ